MKIVLWGDSTEPVHTSRHVKFVQEYANRQHSAISDNTTLADLCNLAGENVNALVYCSDGSLVVPRAGVKASSYIDADNRSVVLRGENKSWAVYSGAVGFFHSNSNLLKAIKPGFMKKVQALKLALDEMSVFVFTFVKL